MASLNPLTKFVIHSNPVHLRHVSNSENVPDIERTGQREYERTEKDGRRRPLELTVLSVVKIRGCDLDEKQNGKDQVDHGKDHPIAEKVEDLSAFFTSFAKEARNQLLLGKAETAHMVGKQPPIVGGKAKTEAANGRRAESSLLGKIPKSLRAQLLVK